MNKVCRFGHLWGTTQCRNCGFGILKKEEAIIIVPSGRIDYYGDCDKNHGYDCPKYIKTWKVGLILDITGIDLTYEKAFKMFTDIVLNDNHYPFRNLKVIEELDKPENR